MNPWLGDPHIEDFAAYLDRTAQAQGMIRGGDAAVTAFEADGTGRVLGRSRLPAFLGDGPLSVWIPSCMAVWW